MFDKLFRRLKNRFDLVTANNILSTYCVVLERVVANSKDPSISRENLKETVENAGCFVALQTISGMPPRSMWQQTIANNLEKWFENCSGISNDDVRSAIAIHIHYACSKFHNADEEAQNCRLNLDLTKCKFYPRFSGLRDQVKQLLAGIG